MKIVEICCGSYYDCLAAFNGGAKRVELNSALHLGGLTPSVGALQLAKAHTDLKIITMVRPRGAGFNYHDADIETMFVDAKCMLENGADGIAFGFLNTDATIQTSNVKKMVELIHSYHKEAVFHRAFDCVNDPITSMQLLVDLGVDRVLTSGLKAKAVDGIKTIRQLQAQFGDRIEILAGSGINESNAAMLMEETGISQVHSSCKDWLEDPTTSGAEVSYAYHNANDYDVVSEYKVKKLIDAVK